MRTYLAHHDIIYHSPIEAWANGFPLGNGDMAAVAFTENRDFCLGVNKVDVWDLRFKRKPFTPHQKVLQLIQKKDWNALHDKIYQRETEPYRKDPFPTPKPCGILRIKELISGNGTNYEQRLCLSDGLLKVKGSSFSLSTFVNAHSNLLVLKCQSDSNIVMEFIRKEDKTLDKPIFGSNNKYFWVEVSFPEGLRYLMVGRIKGKGYRIRKIKDGFSIATNSQETKIYLSVVTSLETKELLQKGIKTIEKGLNKGYETLLSQHRDWWHSFWQKSFIEIPDKLLENLWYYGLYLLASSSRGSLPPPITPLWSLEDNFPWHGDYHTNLNIEMLYWPSLSSNHLELGEPFYRNFFEVLPKVKKETKEFFGIEGAKYSFSPIPTGEEIAGGYWRYELYVTAWVGQMFWWFYLYSQNKEFLKEKAYPVMKEILKFYEGYLSKDKDGKYYIFPSHTPEQQPPGSAHYEGSWGEDVWTTDKYDNRTTNWEKNVLIDLSLLKYLLKSGLEATKVLNKDKNKRILWEKILNNLSPYPNNGEVFLEYEGAPADFLTHHATTLSPIFPCYEIRPESPLELYNIAKTTLETICSHTIRKDPRVPFPIPSWGDDCNWLWLAISAAELGLGDLCRAYIYDMGILCRLEPNGWLQAFNQTPEEWKKSPIRSANSNTGIAKAINEMLLQSCDRIIRVFPAIPSDWRDCRFIDLRAVGAFLVSSEIKNRKIDYILIESLAGKRCKVINLFDDEEMEVTESNKRIKQVNITDKIISFATKKGKFYLIKRREAKPSVKQKLYLKYRGELSREYSGPQYLSKDVDKEKMWTVRLGN